MLSDETKEILLIAALIVGFLACVAFDLWRIKQVCQASPTGIYFDQGSSYKCPDAWSKK